MAAKIISMVMSADTNADMQYIQSIAQQNKAELRSPKGSYNTENVYPNTATLVEMVFPNSTVGQAVRTTMNTAGHKI